MRRMSSNKSNSILNDGLLKAFSPFHHLQTILGVCRVHIRNKTVKPVNVFHKLYTCAIVLTASLLFFALLSYYMERYSDAIIMQNVVKCLGFIEWSSLLIVIGTTFLYNNENVDFYLKMHQIDRLLKVEKNKFMTSLLFKMNRITVIGLVILGISFFILLSVYYDYQMTFSSLGAFYIQMTYILEFLYFCSIVYYFCLRIRFLNAIILNHLEPEFIRVKLASKQTKNLIRISAADTQDFAYCNIDNYVKELMNCFNKFQTIYRYQIFLSFLKLILSFICYIEFGVVSLKWRSLHLTDTYIMIFLSITDASLICLACVRCETFIREAKFTRRLSVSILCNHNDGLLRMKAKRILKVLQENPPIFSVFQMWDLNANTILQLFGIITTMFFNILSLNYLEE